MVTPVSMAGMALMPVLEDPGAALVPGASSDGNAVQSSSSSAQPPGVGVSMACDHFMLMHVEQLARSLTTLSNAVQGIESRQTSMDEKVAELSTRLQGLQEGHNALAERQDMVSTMVSQKQEEDHGHHKAMLISSGGTPTGEVRRFLESRLDEHERRLTKLSVDVTMLASRAGLSGRTVDADGAPKVSNECNVLSDRLLELERGQKKVVAAAQKALKMSMGLQQHQRRQLQQQENLDALLKDSWACPPTPCNLSEAGGYGETNWLAARVEEQDQVVSDLRHHVEGLSGLRERVDELQQAVVYNVASQQLNRHGEGSSGQRSTDAGALSDTLMKMLQAVQTRVDRNIGEMSRRLDSLQASREQQRVETMKLTRQVPDMGQKIEQLSSQCQSFFSNAKQIESLSGRASNTSDNAELLPSREESSQNDHHAADDLASCSSRAGTQASSCGFAAAAASTKDSLRRTSSSSAGSAAVPKLAGLPFGSSASKACPSTPTRASSPLLRADNAARASWLPSTPTREPPGHLSAAAQPLTPTRPASPGRPPWLSESSRTPPRGECASPVSVSLASTTGCRALLAEVADCNDMLGRWQSKAADSVLRQPAEAAATPTPTRSSTAPATRTADVSAANSQDPGGSELFGSSSVFNVGRSTPKAQKELIANDFYGK